MEVLVSEMLGKGWGAERGWRDSWETGKVVVAAARFFEPAPRGVCCSQQACPKPSRRPFVPLGG